MPARPIHLCSLNSSFAAGPGIYPQSSWSALRSALNYPSILASHLAATHTDRTVSGATLLNFSYVAQGSYLPLEWRGQRLIVTLTAGGNDIGYIGQMTKESYKAYPPLSWFLNPSIPSPYIPDEELLDRFKLVIRLIRERQPSAIILIVQYPTILGRHTDPRVNAPFTAQQVKAFRGLENLLLRVNLHAADGEEGIHVVPVKRESAPHGLGSPQEWINGHRWFPMFWGEFGWLPNKAGMEAVAGVCWEYLKGLGTE